MADEKDFEMNDEYKSAVNVTYILEKSSEPIMWIRPNNSDEIMAANVRAFFFLPLMTSIP